MSSSVVEELRKAYPNPKSDDKDITADGNYYTEGPHESSQQTDLTVSAELLPPPEAEQGADDAHRHRAPEPSQEANAKAESADEGDDNNDPSGGAEADAINNSDDTTNRILVL